MESGLKILTLAGEIHDEHAVCAIEVLLALSLFFVLACFYVKDIMQKKHAILRNYPIIGWLRYIFEQPGKNFR